MLDCVRAKYRESQSALRTRSGLTHWFPMLSGVSQACGISPLLCITYMDIITKSYDISPEDDRLSDLRETLFDDDQCLLHN